MIDCRSWQPELVAEAGNWSRFSRTEVRGDFNVHGTKYFQDAVFHQKSKIYNVVSLLYLWLAKNGQISHALHEILSPLVSKVEMILEQR